MRRDRKDLDCELSVTNLEVKPNCNCHGQSFGGTDLWANLADKPDLYHRRVVPPRFRCLLVSFECWQFGVWTGIVVSTGSRHKGMVTERETQPVMA